MCHQFKDSTGDSDTKDPADLAARLRRGSQEGFVSFADYAAGTAVALDVQDADFAMYFLPNNGMNLIYDAILSSQGSTLAYALSALDASTMYGFGLNSIKPSADVIKRICACFDSEKVSLNVCSGYH